MTTLILPTSQLRRRSGPGDSLLIHITVRIADLLSRCQRRTRRQRSSHGRDRDAKPGSCPGRQEANPGSRICRPWRSYVLTAGLDIGQRRSAVTPSAMSETCLMHGQTGMHVYQTTTLEYPPNETLRWCHRHQPCLTTGPCSLHPTSSHISRSPRS
jgi:hypothetical protein